MEPVKYHYLIRTNKDKTLEMRSGIASRYLITEYIYFERLGVLYPALF